MKSPTDINIESFNIVIKFMISEYHELRLNVDKVHELFLNNIRYFNKELMNNQIDEWIIRKDLNVYFGCFIVLLASAFFLMYELQKIQSKVFRREEQQPTDWFEKLNRMLSKHNLESGEAINGLLSWCDNILTEETAIKFSGAPGKGVPFPPMAANPISGHSRARHTKSSMQFARAEPPAYSTREPYRAR